MQAATSPQSQPQATRSATACVRCRRQKTKCLHDDDGQPCGGCIKAHQPCVFSGKAPRVPKAPGLSPPANTNATAASAITAAKSHVHSTQHAHSNASLLDLDAHRLEAALDCERALDRWPLLTFHRPSFKYQLKGGHLPQTLLRAMLSSDARASPTLVRQFGSAAAAADFFADRAQGSVLSSMACPSVPDVQSLCLLVMHHWGSGRGTCAYLLLAVASRMALFFLPQATAHDGDFVDAELARRAIWTCFVLDQLLCCGNSRRPSLCAEELHLPLPCSEDNFHFGIAVTMPSITDELQAHPLPHSPHVDAGEFIHMIKIAVLWRRAISWVMHPPKDEQDDVEHDKIRADLHCWARKLPSRQQDIEGKIDLHIQLRHGYQFAFTHCIHYCALIFLARKQLLRMMRRSDTRSLDAVVSASMNTIGHAACRVKALITTLDSSAAVVDDADTPPPAFPIIVLFAAYAAASTVANMVLQGAPMPGNLVHGKVDGGDGDQQYRVARDMVTPVLPILAKSASVWPLAERWHSELNRLSADLDARDNNASLTTAHERHDSHQPHVPTFATVNGASSESQHHSPPKYRQPNGVVDDATSEWDSKAFDRHLNGLDDLVPFFGADGFNI